jgi:hypothetical protein
LLVGVASRTALSCAGRLPSPQKVNCEAGVLLDVVIAKDSKGWQLLVSCRMADRFLEKAHRARLAEGDVEPPLRTIGACRANRCLDPLPRERCHAQPQHVTWLRRSRRDEARAVGRDVDQAHRRLGHSQALFLPGNSRGLTRSRVSRPTTALGPGGRTDRVRLRRHSCTHEFLSDVEVQCARQKAGVPG